MPPINRHKKIVYKVESIELLCGYCKEHLFVSSLLCNNFPDRNDKKFDPEYDATVIEKSDGDYIVICPKCHGTSVIHRETYIKLFNTETKIYKPRVV